jgi:hypothetical protein
VSAIPSGGEIHAPGRSALWVLRGSCNAHGPRPRLIRADILPVLAGPSSSVRHGDVACRSGGAAGTLSARRIVGLANAGNAGVDVGLYRHYAPVSVYRADERIAIAVLCGSGVVAAAGVPRLLL